MPTLSVSCPKCQKGHQRIKPEMVGRKVRCQCGFVFRIGSRANKQPVVSEKLNREKTAKARQPVSKQANQPQPDDASSGLFDLKAPLNPIEPDQSGLLQNVPASPRNTPLENPTEHSKTAKRPEVAQRLTPLKADEARTPEAPSVDRHKLSDSCDESLDQKSPLDPNESSDNETPKHVPFTNLSAPATPSDNFVELEPLEDSAAELIEPLPLGEPVQAQRLNSDILDPLDALPDDMLSGGFQSPNQALPRLVPAAAPVPRPKRTRRKPVPRRSTGPRLQSPAGAIWTIVLTIIGVPWMSIVTISLISNSYKLYGVLTVLNGVSSRATGAFVHLIAPITVSLIMGLLVISMIATGIVAIIELSTSRHVKWASTTSAVLGSLVLFGLFIMLALQISSLAKADHPEMGAIVARMFGRFAIKACVPLAVTITGFARCLRN